MDLRGFGDAIFLDGTAIKNPMEWTTYPITLVNDERELGSEGLMFTAFEREEVFEWILELLDRVLGATLQTIFTDEDSSIVLATNSFRGGSRLDVAHRVCLLHKKQNFTRRLKASPATGPTREVALHLFDELCYSKRESEVMDAYNKIRQLVPGVPGYLDAEVMNVLPQFAEAFRVDTFTLGFHSTSPAESANDMLKRSIPSKIQRLVQIRESYTRAYHVKALGVMNRKDRQFRVDHFLRTILEAPVSRAVCELVDVQVRESLSWKVTRSDDNSELFEALNEKNVRWKLATNEPGPKVSAMRPLQPDCHAPI
jgi:hypothetical protein